MIKLQTLKSESMSEELKAAHQKTATRYLTAVDLFSGAGGFSEGLAQAGIKTLVAQELHPQPALTHIFNHPGAIGVVGDIRQLSPDLIKDLLARHHNVSGVDLVVGGPPCQGFSTAGSKKKDDPRNSLFEHYCNIVAYLRPKAIVFENVPGFKNMYQGEMYRAAVKRLKEIGYLLSDQILNAVEYGVPQRRKRFVMVGVREDLGLEFKWPEQTHADPEGTLCDDLFSSPLEKFVSVFEAISDIAFLKPGEEAHQHQLPPSSEYQSNRRTSPFLFNHLATKHREKAVSMFRLIAEGHTINSVPSSSRSSKKTMARLNRNGISNTVLALPDDLIHYHHDRIPTVREMARLQSFDDDYVFIGKRTSGFMERKHDVPQYTQVGNAVPPLLAKAIGESLVEMFKATSTDVRQLDERIKRLTWVRGTSGYSGYTLSAAAECHLSLYNINGSKIPLPIDETPIPVQARKPIEDWRNSRNEMPARQWAPGVMPMEASAPDCETQANRPQKSAQQEKEIQKSFSS